MDGNGLPSAAVLDAVRAKFADQDIRPLTDRVTVLPAEIVEYDVVAVIHMMTGPSPDSVKEAARKDLERYVAERHKLGLGVAVSGIYEALHISGVIRVELQSPNADISVEAHQAAYCRSIDIEMSVS
jgi:phage-related baseplate assembly protein